MKKKNDSDCGVSKNPSDKIAGNYRISQISRRRLWLYRMVAFFVAPLLFLMALEAGLWVFGFGYPTSFIVPCDLSGEKAFCSNDKYTWQFFPPKLARTPIPFVFIEPKQPRTYRIFILGASAAQGDPMPAFGFGRILEVMLRDQYPDMNFEVVNTAVTATNSHVVLNIAKDLVRHQPDLFIIYLGNNEVVGPYGAGTVFSPLSSNLSIIRAGIFVKSTRTGQLIQKILLAAGADRSTPAEWKGMEMFLGKRVRADDPGLLRVYTNFRKNLEDIASLAFKSGIKTVFCTVGSNLKDSPPFASLHQQNLPDNERNKWEKQYRAGSELEAKGMHAEAVKRYLEAEKIDSRFADLQYRLGRSFWILGDYQEAKGRYIRARNLDTLRFRPDSRINEIIRQVAGERPRDGIYLVDAVRAFEESSPQGTPGEELFYEHVHMNFTGNYILAASVFRQVEEVLPVWILRNKRNNEMLSEKECEKKLAFTGYERFVVTKDVIGRLKQPPFTDQLYHQKRLIEWEKIFVELKGSAGGEALKDTVSEYRKAINAAPSDPWLRFNFGRMLLNERLNLKEASEQLKGSLRFLPNHIRPYELLAKTMIILGKYQDAIRWCEAVLKMKPDFVTVHLHMAYALAKSGNLEKSMEKYREILTLDPKMVLETYTEMGRIQLYQGNLDRAAEIFRKALAYDAGSQNKKEVADINFNLGYVLKQMGKTTEAYQQLQLAAKAYRKQLSENPDVWETHAVLARTLLEIGDLKGAAKHYQTAADLNPIDPAGHINLIKTLEAQGRWEEAITASRKAIRVLSDHEAIKKIKKSLELLIHKKKQREQSSR